MRIIETEAYQFDELSDTAKEKARDWWKEGNDYPFLSEEMEETAIDLLLKYKIKDASDLKVYYSLSYCQGDGAMVEFVADWKAWRVTVKQYGHYSHERSTTIELTSNKTGEYAPAETETDFEENVYIPMCLELKKYGYDFIDTENEDEYVDENILANEYEFHAEGARIWKWTPFIL